MQTPCNLDYFKRLFEFLTNLDLSYNYKESSEYVGEIRITSILTFRHLNSNWILSSKQKGLVNVIIVCKETKKTYYFLIHIDKEKLTPVTSMDKYLPSDYLPSDILDFAERLIHIRNNAVSFILGL